MRACHLLSHLSTFAHPVLTTLNALPTHPARFSPHGTIQKHI